MFVVIFSGKLPYVLFKSLNEGFLRRSPVSNLNILLTYGDGVGRETENSKSA